MDQFLNDFLNLLNETLAAAIVVVAASLLLYNLSRNMKDRVARTSGAVLACVTAVYVGDVLMAFEPGPQTFEALLRFQWIGLAFIPTTLFHLSDALLATTGRPSRGRRRRVIRILYLQGIVFLLLASFTDLLIDPVPLNGRFSLKPGPIFPVYFIYFLMVIGIAFFNVERARRRCLTRSTERRMTYLQITFLTPAIGVFPYSVLLGTGQEFSLSALLLVNIANFFVILMLLFLAYPLSFFGSRIPDRVVKTELLRFLLRGPATGLLALVVIIFTDPTTRTFGLPGDLFIPFGTVTIILMWQWSIDIALPWLERRLIYPGEDGEEMEKLQRLNDRSLSRTDLMQLLEAILESACDYLRVNRAFIVSLSDRGDVLRYIGAVPSLNGLANSDTAMQRFADYDESPQRWQDFWILPLHSSRSIAANGQGTLIGILGIEARTDQFDLDEYEIDMLRKSVHRAAQTLDDTLLLTEIYAALEGLLPQLSLTRGRAAEVEYRPRQIPQPHSDSTLPQRDEIIEQVRAALRHYWGGPGLSRSRLLELAIVRHELDQPDNTPVQALQKVLRRAIEMQRPEGENDPRSQEWTLYNILNKRFIEKRKARETARSLYMSEANLYRKQNIAIEAVADTIITMETDTQTQPSDL